jgi:hypothetical protein
MAFVRQKIAPRQLPIAQLLTGIDQSGKTRICAVIAPSPIMRRRHQGAVRASGVLRDLLQKRFSQLAKEGGAFG